MQLIDWYFIQWSALMEALHCLPKRKEKRQRTQRSSGVSRSFMTKFQWSWSIPAKWKKNWNILCGVPTRFYNDLSLLRNKRFLLMFLTPENSSKLAIFLWKENPKLFFPFFISYYFIFSLINALVYVDIWTLSGTYWTEHYFVY